MVDRMTKQVPATAFKAECLRLIDEMREDGEAVIVTKHGKPVAMVSPLRQDETGGIVGALSGSVLRYDDPFAPAVEDDAWNALR